jgi:general secretion pathway protein D
VSVTIAAPPQVKVQDQFKIEVKATEVAGLVSAPFVLVYDPIFVEFIAGMEGDLLKKDGRSTVFRSVNDRNTGQVTFSVARGAGAGGVNGAGTIATATFKAKNQGPASFGLMGVNFTSQGGQIETLPYNTVIEVK